MSEFKVLSLSGRHAVAQDTVATILRRRGFQVDLRKIGPTALADLDQYDFLVLEIGGTGGELSICTRLREDSKAPLLLLVQSSARMHGVQGLELGADDFISIPFDHREIAARIEALLRRGRGGKHWGTE